MTTISIVLVVVPVGSRDHSTPLDSRLSTPDSRGLAESSRLEGPPRPCAQTQASSSRGHRRGHDDRGRGTKQLSPSEFLGPRPRPHAGLYRIPPIWRIRPNGPVSLPRRCKKRCKVPQCDRAPSNVHRNLNHAPLAWLHAVAWRERGGPACSCSPRAVPVTGLPACRLP